MTLHVRRENIQIEWIDFSFDGFDQFEESFVDILRSLKRSKSDDRSLLLRDLPEWNLSVRVACERIVGRKRSEWFVFVNAFYSLASLRPSTTTIRRRSERFAEDDRPSHVTSLWKETRDLFRRQRFVSIWLVESVSESTIDLLTRVEEKFFDKRCAIHRNTDDTLVSLVDIETLFDFNFIPNLSTNETDVHERRTPFFLHAPLSEYLRESRTSVDAVAHRYEHINAWPIVWEYTRIDRSKRESQSYFRRSRCAVMNISRVFNQELFSGWNKTPLLLRQTWVSSQCVTLSSNRFGWEMLRFFLGKDQMMKLERIGNDHPLPVRCWTTGRVIDIRDEFERALEILTNDGNRSCTRTKPDQTRNQRLEWTESISNYLADVRSSSPIFSFSMAICRKRAINLNERSSIIIPLQQLGSLTCYRIAERILLNVPRQSRYPNRSKLDCSSERVSRTRTFHRPWRIHWHHRESVSTRCPTLDRD